MKRKLMMYLCLSLLILPWCGQAQNKKLPVATLIPKIVCEKDSKYSYCLYLPKGYTPTKKWTVLYVFDPSGKPIRPVKILQHAADTYGYILVGCHNYINGPADLNIIVRVSEDLTTKVSMNPKRLYTTGFSGGARYAFTLTQLTNSIKGIIAVGAGYFSGTPPQANQKTDWVGVVGYLDFNWQEMNQLQKHLTKLDYPNSLLRYKGRHQWPPDSVMTLAVECLELKAMKRKEIAANPRLIAKVYQHLFKTAQGFEAKHALYYAYQTYREIIRNLSGLIDLSEVKKKQKALESHKAFKPMLAKVAKMQQQEQALSNTYTKAFNESLYPRQPGVKSLEWWQSSYDELSKIRRNSQDVQEKYFTRRMFAFAFGGAIERAMLLRSKGLVGDGKFATERFLRIAHIFWQKNNKVTMGLVRFYAQTNQGYQMYRFLKIALKHGFKNKKAFENKVFDKWRNKKKFRKIVGRI